LVGKIVRGVNAVKELPLNFTSDGNINFKLYQPDFTSSYRVSSVINDYFGEDIASSDNAANIIMQVPQAYTDENRIVEFLALIEQIEVEPDVAAKVVVNERTGTVVVGRDVKIMPVAISHGDLTIQISPAQAGAPGQPPIPAETGSVIVLGEREGSNIGNLAEALNALKVNPKDIIAIFEALREVGALKAELVVM
ncbi:flagellar basal body P-ring protein FlgI, partial [bacterium]|nr:flagellar basal body P-ring protein FlgI [bacterium]